MNDVNAVLGMMWKQLKAQQKQPFEEEYEKDKTKYDAAMIEYNRKYPNEKANKKKSK